MALSKNTVGTNIKNFLVNLTPAQKDNVETIWRGIMNEVIEHLKSNGEIFDIVVDPETGQQTGTGKIK